MWHEESSENWAWDRSGDPFVDECVGLQFSGFRHPVVTRGTLCKHHYLPSSAVWMMAPSDDIEGVIFGVEVARELMEGAIGEQSLESFNRLGEVSRRCRS